MSPLAPDRRATVAAALAPGSFFTAPVTGLVPVVEMTGVSSLLVPMLAACCGALGGAALAGSPPGYDALRERAALRPGPGTSRR